MAQLNKEVTTNLTPMEDQWRVETKTNGKENEEKTVTQQQNLNTSSFEAVTHSKEVQQQQQVESQNEHQQPVVIEPQEEPERGNLGHLGRVVEKELSAMPSSPDPALYSNSNTNTTNPPQQQGGNQPQFSLTPSTSNQNGNRTELQFTVNPRDLQFKGFNGQNGEFRVKIEGDPAHGVNMMPVGFRMNNMNMYGMVNPFMNEQQQMAYIPVPVRVNVPVNFGMRGNSGPIDLTLTGRKRKRKNRLCAKLGCEKNARGKTAFCVRHGGGTRCAFEGCDKGARPHSKFCSGHGGGHRCQYAGCRKGALAKSIYCRRHGKMALRANESSAGKRLVHPVNISATLPTNVMRNFNVGERDVNLPNVPMNQSQLPRTVN